MKKLIPILIVLIGFLASCKTPQVMTTTNTVTKYRDTTVYVELPVYIDKIIKVPLPSDTIRITEKVYVNDQGLATMKSIHKEQGIIAADIAITDGKLNANFYLKDSTLLYNYKDTLTVGDSIKIYNAIKEKLTTTTNTVIKPPERYVSKFSKFTHWYFVITFLILIGYIVYRVKTQWVKGLLGKIKLPMLLLLLFYSGDLIAQTTTVPLALRMDLVTHINLEEKGYLVPPQIGTLSIQVRTYSVYQTSSGQFYIDYINSSLVKARKYLGYTWLKSYKLADGTVRQGYNTYENNTIFYNIDATKCWIWTVDRYGQIYKMDLPDYLTDGVLPKKE